MAWENLEDNVRDPEVVKLYEDRGEKVQLDEGARKSIVVTVIPAAAETRQGSVSRISKNSNHPVSSTPPGYESFLLSLTSIAGRASQC
ncbi:MAG TPA: hypothetical protein VNY29_17555 [Terriglobales bacterium]|nr:hypothetical protein [Terriglobales bacterium]